MRIRIRNIRFVFVFDNIRIRIRIRNKIWYIVTSESVSVRIRSESIPWTYVTLAPGDKIPLPRRRSHIFPPKFTTEPAAATSCTGRVRAGSLPPPALTAGEEVVAVTLWLLPRSPPHPGEWGPHRNSIESWLQPPAIRAPGRVGRRLPSDRFRCGVTARREAVPGPWPP
jgi:hypothetical protein